MVTVVLSAEKAKAAATAATAGTGTGTAATGEPVKPWRLQISVGELLGRLLRYGGGSRKTSYSQADGMAALEILGIRLDDLDEGEREQLRADLTWVPAMEPTDE